MTKKKLALALTLICMLLPAADAALSAVAQPGVFTLTDPVTGVSIQAENHGDERFHFTADTEGRVLATNEQGAYCYVEKQTGGGFRLGPPIANPPPPNPALARMDDENLRDGLTALRATILPQWEQALRNPRRRSTARIEMIPDDYDFSSLADPLSGSVGYYDHALIQVPPKERACALAVILVEFDDVGLQFTDENWRKRIFDDGVSNYYQTVSNGRFTYQPVNESYGRTNDGVIRVRLPIDAPLYAAPNSGNQNLFNDVLAGLYVNGQGRQYAIFNATSLFAYAMEAAKPYLTLDGYDRNGDGFISPTEVAFLVVCAGYEAASCPDPYGKTAVWAHSSVFNTARFVETATAPRGYIGESACVQMGNVWVYKYTIMGENTNDAYDYASPSPSEQAVQSQFGTACHELGHDLGLADLYNTGQASTQLNVEYLSVMANGVDGAAWGEERTSRPTHFDPESKIRLGFYEPTVADKSGVYPLYATEPADRYNILRINTDNPDIYYLVENRRFIGYDKGMERGYSSLPEGGVVIWRVNDERIRNHYSANTLNNDENDFGIMPVFLDESMMNRYQMSIPFWGGAYRALGRTSFAIPERPGAMLYCENEGGALTTVRLVLPSKPAAPQTGDAAAPLRWGLLALAAALCMAGAARRRRA